MTEPTIEIDRDLLARRLDELAAFGAHGETGVWRTVYSPAWIAAADRYARWCDEAGLGVRRDAVGNIWGRAEGQTGGGAVVTGSHIDTVTPGGRYDGALGAIGGLLAVQALLHRFGPPRRPLEAVALCEEESSRFRANFWGSRAIVGEIAEGIPHSIADADGVTIAEAMREAGLDPGRCGEARRNDIEAFIELHIEQGPVLEQAGVPLAIVTGITAIRGVAVELRGVANHAGAYPMSGRRDPMAGFAEIAAGVIETARGMGDPAVTTIGRVVVEPNAATVIPESVRFTIDARHPDPGLCRTLWDRHEALMTEVARRRNLELSWRVTSEHDACASDPQLVAILKEAAAATGAPAIEMVSGAAHDAQQIARIAPVAMIFVRSRDGRSHTPEEYSSIDDMAAGVTVLAHALYRLAYG